MQYLIFSFLLFSIVGCASGRPIILSAELIDEPNIGEVVSADIGDPVLRKGEHYPVPAINLLNPISKDAGLFVGFDIPVQQMLAVYEDENYTYYQATQMIQKELLVGNSPVRGGICVSKKDRSIAKVYVAVGHCGLKIEPDPVLSFATVPIMSELGFLQELLYNGRVGNYVRFLYRDSSQNAEEPENTEDLQHNLDEGNDVVFRGARLEVLSASNKSLQYRVLKSFEDPQE
ncbi:MAG: hypothetical protein AAGH49_07910 [Pseudomonadota bacterium]